ncbi:MAG: response regulator transcription factor, partial [Acidimicrobiia bacterium]|nr:response regulator transcription factor [Acidimicrobiia bacterium]
MIRVVIADDHRMLLDGLAEALDGLPDIEVIGTAETGRHLLETLERVTPDVLLVDIEMPLMSGIQALRKLPTPIPAVVVTMHTGDDERSRAAAAGAVGFLSKSAPLPDLAAAVRAAAAGEVFMDGDPIVLGRHRAAVLDAQAEQLTARERELLALLASGISATDDLADRMFISQKTVKNHLASIYEKLAITDRAQA